MDRRGFLRTPLLALAAYASARKVTPAPLPTPPLDVDAFQRQMIAQLTPEMRRMIATVVIGSSFWMAR